MRKKSTTQILIPSNSMELERNRGVKTVFIKNIDRKMKRLYKAIKKLDIIDPKSPILINANIFNSEKLHNFGVINGRFNTCSEIISCSVVSNKDFSNNRNFKIIEIGTIEKEDK